MIKFFRKIRQKWLVEGNMKKYLAYSMGEILLVVIGILIALQINNWNEERKALDLARSFLFALREDLELDLEELKRNESFMDLGEKWGFNVWNFLYNGSESVLPAGESNRTENLSIR